MDHIIPRSQGGQDHACNGLPLCGPFSKKSPFPNGCHAAKTDRKFRITRAMLDRDQIEYLAGEGWVAWDDDGSVRGHGMKGFA
jgi:hypothetical protein